MSLTPGVLVDPPCDELGHPRISVRVARRAHIGPHAASRPIARQHVEELRLREVAQLIENDQGDLRPLVGENVLVILQVPHLHLRARREIPLEVWAGLRLGPEQGVQFHRLGPQAARRADLGAIAPEEQRRELFYRRVAD
ncbi:hypothetical protein G6F57_021583 [Rhizopus arrhizus]|nr:hypothetical protein G6F40_015675 [Rhizopus arrhizus]KAG1434453.1 hypothetical protein G6F57_021583 [Rhizopus arrhizus]